MFRPKLYTACLAGLALVSPACAAIAKAGDKAAAQPVLSFKNSLPEEGARVDEAAAPAHARRANAVTVATRTLDLRELSAADFGDVDAVGR